MSPRLRRLLRGTGLTLVAITAALLMTVGSLIVSLRSEAGTRWLLEILASALPELQTQNPHGNLVDGLHLQTLRWETPDLVIAIDELDVRLHWPDLLRGFATLDPLRAQRLLINPRGPDNSDPIVLPTLVAPIVLNVPLLRLAELRIVSDGTVTKLSGIEAAARWIGTDLNLRNTRLNYTGLDLAADARLRFHGDYPLRLAGNLNGGGLPGAVAVKARGSLRKFKLEATSSGDWPLSAQAELRLLDEHLPLRLTAHLTQPLQQDLGVDRVNIQKAELSAEGDLRRISGALQARLSDSRYGESQLDNSLVWDGSALAVQSRLQLPTGNVQSDCTLQTAAPPGWSCHGAIADLPLAPWLNGLAGQVSTTFAVAGHFDDSILLTIELPALTGQLDGIDLRGALRVASADLQSWDIADASLSAGPNQIRARGNVGARSQLQVELQAPNLANLYAGLSGSAQARIDLAGAIAQPTVRGSVALHDIHYEGMQLQSGSARIALSQLGQAVSDIRFNLHGLLINGIALDADAALVGTQPRHQWQLALHHGNNHGELKCNGQLTVSSLNYLLDCPLLRGSWVASPKRTISWSQDGRLHAQWSGERNEGEIAALCLRSNPAAACLKPGLRLQQGKLLPFTASISQMPLRWWREYFPDGLHLRNDAQLTALLEFSSQKPLRLRAEARIDASEWRWLNGDAVQNLALDAVVASAMLDANKAQLSTALHSPTVGSATAELTVIDPLGAKTLQGQLSLADFQLGALGWVIPDAETLSGQVNGAVAIAGSASQPLVRGQFALSKGTVAIAGSPDTITDLTARLQFDNRRADLNGQFHLGAGVADLTGAMQWAEDYRDWRASLQLHGRQLRIEPLPNSDVLLAPDLSLTLAPGKAQLVGDIQLEKADIRLQQLPPDTVNPSRDAIVSGRETAPAPTDLAMDLALHLGDNTHFSGFGADVDLSGQLRLHQEPPQELRSTGRINVTKGRYRAYGQRLIVRKGQFIFTGNLDDPDLNLEAIRELPPGNTDVVGLRVTGSLRDPVAQLFSDQSLSESDIAYYLLTGRKRDTLGKAGNQFSAGGTLLSLGLSGGEDQAAKLAEKFGISGLQLGTAAARDGTTEAEVSGYVFRDLYVRYGRSLGERVDSVTFQYQLSPHLMIQTISGIEETLELIYTFTID